MQWRALQFLDTDLIFGKQLNAEIRAIQEEIERVDTNRRGLDEAIQKYQSSDVESLDFDNLIGFPALKALIATTLQDEVKVRRRMAAVYHSANEAYCKEREKAHSRHLQAQEEVRASLVQIGYVDEPPSSGAIGRIMPGYIDAHPKVHAARLRSNELNHRAQNHDLPNLNDLALSHALQELAKARDQTTKL